MRTTITLGDASFFKLKKEAQARRCTLGELVEESLQIAIFSKNKKKDPATSVRWKTFKGTGVCEGVDLSSNHSLYDRMDEL